MAEILRGVSQGEEEERVDLQGLLARLEVRLRMTQGGLWV